MGGNLGPEFGGFFGDGAGDSRALGFSFVVDDHAGVVLAVKESSVGSAPRSALSDYHCRHNFLSQLLDAFLHRAEANVSDGSVRQSVEMSANSFHGDYVQ